jgi:Uncharacterised protein family (UPF0158)
MPSSREQQESVTEIGDGGLAASVDNSRIVGSIDPRAPLLSKAAEEAIQLPRQLSRDDVFALLSQAIQSPQLARGAPVAARVAAVMRRLQPTFTQESSGYPTFRELLKDAESAGIVTILERGGTSDVAVVAPGVSVPVSAGRNSSSISHLRNDLWRVFIDWSRSGAYWYDRSSKELHPVAEIPVGPNGVEVPSISRELQTEWMVQFASDLADLSVKSDLESGLASTDPVRGFSSALRRHEASARRWKRYLQKRVLDRATDWAVSCGIALSDLEPTSVAEESKQTGAQVAQAGADIRGEILALLASLPTSELLRLPIPVEYALKR